VAARRHDPRKIAEKDSIPFQLQKLFVNLQTQGQAGLTRDLLRSFQWTEAQAFQQHDVQEFCRKLFDAIEASHKNTFWIKELFGFLISSYIDCGTHRSTRPEEYLDLSLPVRNQYSQELYSSV
jgi:ubiquitin carboxyl-terminal hydrolase 47